MTALATTPIRTLANMRSAAVGRYDALDRVDDGTMDALLAEEAKSQIWSQYMALEAALLLEKPLDRSDIRSLAIVAFERADLIHCSELPKEVASLMVDLLAALENITAFLCDNERGLTAIERPSAALCKQRAQRRAGGALQ